MAKKDQEGDRLTAEAQALKEEEDRLAAEAQALKDEEDCLALEHDEERRRICKDSVPTTQAPSPSSTKKSKICPTQSNPFLSFCSSGYSVLRVVFNCE